MGAGHTGLFFNRARYYSPVFQRFVSEDPIGWRGGTNLFAYVRNSPTNLTDPIGQYPQDVACALATGIFNYAQIAFLPIQNVDKVASSVALATRMVGFGCMNAPTQPIPYVCTLRTIFVAGVGTVAGQIGPPPPSEDDEEGDDALEYMGPVVSAILKVTKTTIKYFGPISGAACYVMTH